MEEPELIQKARDGDPLAMEQLIQRYYQPIFAYLYKSTHDFHQSKDLTQEVFIKMASAISGYKPRGPFKNWLFTIASNRLKNHWRTLARKPAHLPLREEDSVSGCPIDHTARRSDIQAALSRLPPEQRQAIILRYYGDFTVKEIGAITGAGEAAVKARIRRGLNKLKTELEGYDENL